MNQASDQFSNRDSATPRHSLWKTARWIVLAAIVAGVIIYYVSAKSGVERKMLQSQATVQIRDWSLALEKFHVDTGRFPTDDEGLDVLIKQPATEIVGWRGPYLEKNQQRTDPWGRALIYKSMPPNTTAEFVVLSVGADGIEGTTDDVSTMSALGE